MKIHNNFRISALGLTLLFLMEVVSQPLVLLRNQTTGSLRGSER